MQSWMMRLIAQHGFLGILLLARWDGGGLVGCPRGVCMQSHE
jgi:hypothetical protein